jgi:small nuclear ribonucleoprotein (snRNP)-like protein
MSACVGHEVVLDLRSPIVILGRLEAIDPHVLVVADADVHDMTAGQSTKERYILETRKHGIRRNRAQVLVRAAEVVAISKLEDVVPY